MYFRSYTIFGLLINFTYSMVAIELPLSHLILKITNTRQKQTRNITQL